MVNATPGAKGNKMVHKMTIRFFSNGSVKVEGIPSNMQTAILMVNDISAAICHKFVDAARANQLDDQYNIDTGRIVVPQNKVLQ